MIFWILGVKTRKLKNSIAILERSSLHPLSFFGCKILKNSTTMRSTQVKVGVYLHIRTGVPLFVYWEPLVHYGEIWVWLGKASTIYHHCHSKHFHSRYRLHHQLFGVSTSKHYVCILYMYSCTRAPLFHILEATRRIQLKYVVLLYPLTARFKQITA